MKLHTALFLAAWSLFKRVYHPFLYLVLLIGVIVALNVSFGQTAETIPFTAEEVEQVARQNLERKMCLELQEIKEKQIDSLNLKVELIEQESALKDTTINNFKLLVKNYDRIDSLRVEQSNELIATNKEQQKTIKKQNRRLNFWRIFTPVAVTGVSIIALIIK